MTLKDSKAPVNFCIKNNKALGIVVPEDKKNGVLHQPRFHVKALCVIFLTCAFYGSNPLYSHSFQKRNTAYRSGLRKSSKYISCSRRKRNTYLSALPTILFQKDQNKLCAHDKNGERAELCV